MLVAVDAVIIPSVGIVKFHRKRRSEHSLSHFARDHTGTQHGKPHPAAGALPPQVTVQYWLGDKKAAAGHAAAGGNLILSELKYMYADYPFGLMPLGRTYHYEPSLPGAPPENIRGVEMPVWTEFIGDDKTLFAHLFPRLAAVAEVGWSEKTQKSSADFLRRLNALLPQWERLGITAAPKKDWNGHSLAALRQTLRFLLQTSNIETVRRQVSNMKEARVHAKKQGFSL